MINKINSDKPSFEFIVVSGDISQTNTKKSYQLFSGAMQQLNSPVYCIPGNHDDPKLLNNFFPNTPINTITSLKTDKEIMIFINSQVKNQQYGHVSDKDLIDISTLLNNNKDLYAVIVLHHPLILIQSKWMDNIGLKNAKTFLRSVENYQNLKLIIFGHVHQEINTTHKHIKIFGTPSTCYQFKPKTENLQYDDLTPAYRLVNIDNNGTIHSQVYRVPV